MLEQHELEEFVQIFGKKAQPFIKILSSHQAFMGAIQTPVGKTLLKEAVAGMQKSMEYAANYDKIDEAQKERCLADMRAYKGICERWAVIIETYSEATTVIKETIK